MAELHPLGSLKAGLFWRSPCVIGHVDWPEARALVDRGLLTPAEEVRAAAFRVDHARHAFVLGRAILRHGLALANVRERLRLMHDVTAQFDAQLEGDRFVVRIVVPA